VLRWRILLGALFIAALAGLLWLDFAIAPGVWVLALALVIGLAAAQEMMVLAQAGGYDPLRYIVFGGTPLVIGSNAIPLFVVRDVDDQPWEHLGWPLIAFALVLLVGFLGEISRYRAPGKSIVNLALAMLAVAYVGLLLSFAVQLRALGGPVTGMVALVALLVVVKFGDIGAYTVGRLFGRHKMSPVLSPGKTMEGAGGAILFATFGAWLVFTYLPLWVECNRATSQWKWLVFGVVVGGAGLVGDLAESLLKRDVGAKDSSAWMPGFGGVLDMIDSILFAAPVAYLCAMIGMM
jgi:phosphatidate cytidylyltransferase